MEYFLDALQRYADFSGRATRTEYWMYILFYIIILIVLSAVDWVLGIGVLGILFTLGLLIPSIAIAARRLHDTGRSGWWQLVALVPLIGGLVLIVLLVLDSDDDNEYGPDPFLE